MANWCYNHLTVTGSAGDIKDFVHRNLGHTVIAWGKADAHTLARDAAHKLDPPSFFFNALVPVPQEMIAKGYCLLRQGDPYDGHNWCMNNWGCKWDLDIEDPIDAAKMGYSEGCTELSFSFDTANNPPRVWFLRAAALFPTLRLELEYREPMCGIGGCLYGEDGCVNDMQMDRVEVIAEYENGVQGAIVSVRNAC